MNQIGNQQLTNFHYKFIKNKKIEMDIEEIKLIDSSEALYKAYSDADAQFSKFSQLNVHEQNSEEQESPQPIEVIAAFSLKKSDGVKGGNLPEVTQPMDVEEEKQYYVYCSSGESQNQQESYSPSGNNDQIANSTIKKPVKSSVQGYHKNFLVVLSGWITNYFDQLLRNQSISEEVFNIFIKIVDPTDCLSRGGKIYINLIKLSLIFNNDILRPFMDGFLDKGFLRALMCSKTKNKPELFLFLPKLKSGFLNRSITRLR